MIIKHFKKRSWLSGWFCLFILSLAVVAGALSWVSQASPQSGVPTVPDYKRARAEAVPGEILVRFKKEAAAAKGARSEMAVSARGRQITLRLESLGATEIVDGLRLARVTPEDTDQVIAALRSSPDVLYAEPNFMRYKQAVPNDVRYPEQLGLKNTGQSGGLAGSDIKAEPAWDLATGSRNVVVAVIDEGIDINHQDLQANIWHNAAEVAGNGMDDDGNGYVDDVSGFDFFHNDASVYDGPGTNPDGSAIDAHGTHVAGTIGATGNNGIGVAGVNWQVSLLSLKFLGPDGGTSADLLKAYAYTKMMRDLWISDHNQGADIRITNNSYGGGGFSQAEADAIQALGASGILFVAAAGNETQDNNNVPIFPASYDLPNVISVAASDRQDNLAFFSDRGSHSVHLGAPGDNILSTTPGNAYKVESGTSMASPHVAGAAALVLSVHPDFSLGRLRAAVLFGSAPNSSLSQTTITGNRLDAFGALQNATETDTTAPAAIGNLHINGQNGRAVSLGWSATGDDGSNGRAALHEIRFVDQNGAKFVIAAQRPEPGGSQEFADVFIPYRHTSGTITLLTYDNAGNSVSASTSVSVSADAADPYTVTEGPAAALSTGGSHLGQTFDDSVTNYSLPFSFPFFERYSSSVLISTNGAIFLVPSTGSFDLPNGVSRLAGFQMIAGLWDDLDLRTSKRADADIYVVQPDANRIIFRWQGVPCNPSFTTGQCAGGGPVNFEIELDRDGTIVTRYGDGNTQVHPVVGLGGGELDSYPIASHTSESAPKDLTNAGTVTFALKAQPKKADLKITAKSYPTTVAPGDNITYTVTVTNAGPDTASGTSFSNTFPIPAQFVSCTTTQGSCRGPAGNSRVVTGALGSIASGASVTITIVVKTTAFQSLYDDVSTVSARTYDPDMLASSNMAFASVGGYIANPNPITGMTAVAAGIGHYLAIAGDGSLLAWGQNTYGQLGDGTNQDRQKPIYVKTITGVKSIAAGNAHSIAVRPNGNVWTWGYNEYGQLGDGTTTSRQTPGPVPGLTGVNAAAGGAVFTIALKNDGTVWTWGNNSAGQLGNNSTNVRLSPGVVNGLGSVLAISAGSGHSVAVRSDGTVWTWGENSQGQLGDGTTTNRLVPVQVPGLTGITRVAAGLYFTVALKSDGTVWAWGSNNLGQLGNGNTANSSVPVQVGGLTSVTAIAAGAAHTMALKSDGKIWACGVNYSGQLGVGIDLNPTNFLTSPQPVIIVSGVTAIAASSEASVALTASGSIYLWGNSTRNYPYQVDAPLARPALESVSFNPDGGSFTSAQAVTVSLPSAPTSTIKSIAVGGSHTLAAMSDGNVYAWGVNDAGQVGLPPPFSTANYSSIPVPVNGIDSVKQVAGGNAHSLALKTDGTVWAWGSNQYGQSGTGNGNGNSNVPAQVVGLSDVKAIAVRGDHSVALRNDGTVWTWGYNQFGALGDGTTISRATPVQVTGLSNVKAIAAGSEHNIALKNDGTVWTWGYNRIGQLGDGSLTNRLSPVQVTTLSNVISVAAGSVHTVAARGDGTVWVWGDNQYGEVGDGTNSSRFVPTQTVGFSGAASVSAGGDTTAAIRTDGTVWTWGRNYFGVLGTGFPPFSATTPAQVPGLSNISSLVISFSFAAALQPSGNVWMWGDNQRGQLGDLSTTERHAPVPLDFFGSGPAIHYTTNGQEPTDEDPVVSSGATVLVDKNTILKARALREGFAPSAIKSATYEVTLNPIDDARKFVRQHYLDFLNREPDPGGWDYWTSLITQCGVDAACIQSSRLNVSAAFFIELEFQETGYVVYRMYRAAYGTMPGAATRANVLSAQFNDDRALLVGGAGLPQSTIDLANNFVARTAFKTEYPDNMTPAEFVTHLFSKADLTGSANDVLRQAEIDAMTNSGRTRAQVLLRVIEIPGFKDREYQPAFVLMQYFGYLRRDPDQGGYDFWLNILNNHLSSDSSGYRAMVCAFVTSGEYQLRFGSQITHSDHDCSP